jgi:DNA primase
MIYAHEIREKRIKWEGPRPSLPKPLVNNPRAWQLFSSYLRERELDPQLAKQNGWYVARYKDTTRIIIPCSNREGVPYFQGRAMDDNELRYASPPVPRDDSLVIVWPDESKPTLGGVVTEGPMDALAAAGVGFVGVGLMGNCPTDAVLDHLALFARAFQPIYVIPDADAPHFGATIIGALSQHKLNITMRIAPKKDLAEMTLKARRKFFNV